MKQSVYPSLHLNWRVVYNVGIGLLELMLALVIIASLLVVATKYYGYVQREQRINRAVAEIQAIRGAVSQWWAMYHSVESIAISRLIARRLLPESSGMNPWNGTVTVAQNSFSTIVITLSNVPKTVCYRLQRYFTEGQAIESSICNVSNESKAIGAYHLMIHVS